MSTEIEPAHMPIVPVEEAQTCYICYEEGSQENALLDPNPCACKGSIRIHLSCLKEAMKLSQTCSICKTLYTDPELIGCICQRLTYRIAPEICSKYGSSNLYEYYKLDADGKLHGIYRLYTTGAYIGKRLVEEVNYVHGREHGVLRSWNVAKYYFTNNYPSHEITYVDGEVDGPFKVYEYDSDMVEIEGTLKRGAPVKTNWAFNVPDGYCVGEYKQYSKYAREIFGITDPVAYMRYKEDGTYEDGQQILAYMRGNVIVGSIHCNIKNGLLDGEYIALNFRGEVLEHTSYRNGKKHGIYESYNCNMQESDNRFTARQDLYQRANYKNGLLHGARQFFSEGKVVASGNYSNGQQVGAQRIYSHGKLMEMSTLKQDGSGLLHGPATFCDRLSGAVVQTSNYKDGMLDGLLRLYDERGVCAVSIMMKAGAPKPGSQMHIFAMNGEIVETTVIDHGTTLYDLVCPLNVQIRDTTPSDCIGQIIYSAKYAYTYRLTFLDLQPLCAEYTDGCKCANCVKWLQEKEEEEADYYWDNYSDHDDDDDYDRWRSPRDLRGWCVRE